MLIGPDQRPDQDHRGAGCADHVGKDRSEREEARVDRRRTLGRTFDQDAAANDEQRTQQDHQGNVFEEPFDNRLEAGPAKMKDHKPRQRQREQGRNLALVCIRFPPGSAEDREAGQSPPATSTNGITETRGSRSPSGGSSGGHAGHVRAGSAEKHHGGESHAGQERSLHADHSGRGLPFVSGRKGSATRPSRKTTHMVHPA